jgi:E3 ubiquitin-protein ligase HUWE1
LELRNVPYQFAEDLEIARAAVEQNRAAIDYAHYSIRFLLERDRLVTVREPVRAARQARDLQNGSNYLTLDSSTITSHPVQTLLQLSEAIKNNRGNFPRIQYSNNPAVDMGGVTRDCWGKLTSALSQSGLTALPMKQEGERFIPTLSEDSNAVSKADQLKCYRGIGTVFAMSLKEENILTAKHFHPVLFKMMQTLTQEEIHRIPANLENATDIPQDIYKKVFKTYVQDQYPSMGITDEEVEQLFNPDADLPQRIKDLGLELNTLQDLLNYIGFDQIVLPSLVMTQSMVGNLAGSPIQWDMVRAIGSDALMEQIEGSLSKEKVLSSLEWQNSNPTIKAHLEQWIEESSDQRLEQFVQAITGLPTLSSNKLKINCHSDTNRLPAYHTCFNTIDLPNYSDYETFKQKLEDSLVNALSGPGFQIA